MATITADLTLCMDCTTILANGCENDAERAHLLVMFEHTKSWVGTIVVGDHTDEFSARRCDTCDTTLAGHRYSGALLA